MKNLIFLMAILLSACTTSPPSPIGDKPEILPIGDSPKPAVVESTCPAKGSVQAVDMATPADERFMAMLNYLGIGTVIRYYDYPNETIKGKTPKAAELALFRKHGKKVAMVFQHNSNSLATFTPARGKADALRSIELAKQWGQPKGSAIYFGADSDFWTADHQARVKSYATPFCGEVKLAGFKCGVYGNGRTNLALAADGLTQYQWASMSTGHADYKKFIDSGKWNLKQGLTKLCGGKKVDFNVVNPSRADVGAWNP